MPRRHINTQYCVNYGATLLIYNRAIRTSNAPSSEIEYLFEKGLSARPFVRFHEHDVLHELVPFSDDRAFRLYLRGISAALLTFVISEEFISRKPYRVIDDSRRFQHVLHFRPDLFMAADIFFPLSFLQYGFPSISFHNPLYSSTPSNGVTSKRFASAFKVSSGMTLTVCPNASM